VLCQRARHLLLSGQRCQRPQSAVHMAGSPKPQTQTRRWRLRAGAAVVSREGLG
jgi:hypothetical protein